MRIIDHGPESPLDHSPKVRNNGSNGYGQNPPDSSSTLRRFSKFFRLSARASQFRVLSVEMALRFHQFPLSHPFQNLRCALKCSILTQFHFNRIIPLSSKIRGQPRKFFCSVYEKVPINHVSFSHRWRIRRKEWYAGLRRPSRLR